jgi:hypothetical protein
LVKVLRCREQSALLGLDGVRLSAKVLLSVFFAVEEARR